MVRSIHVLPHTHWDREWYDPFPTFRGRLVQMLDELLPRLLGDPSFSHFQLDGQMAVVDDYLAVRPEQRESLQSLSAGGRLSMGPWYVLPDEFLVSGETLIRNLQLGIARAEEFGGAMQVGYLPDMFGHIAAMPQILKLFGFDHAVVWRGVPLAIDQPAFFWESPDGSRVRAEYLSAGYGNGSDMPADASQLRERIEMFLEVQGGLVGDPCLWMAGMDHEAPPAHLSRVVAEFQAQETLRTSTHPEAQRYELHIGSLTEYLESVPSTNLQTHRGELRSGARANLLMGVASNRVDVKIAAARAERTLERLAEPLCTLWSAEPIRDQPLLDLAWLEVIRNAAHDSICACSHDEVVDAVLHRYAEATETAHGVASSAIEHASTQIQQAGLLLLNPCARERTELIEVDLTASALAEGFEALGQFWVQVLAERPAQEELHLTTAADGPMVVARELIFEHPETVHVLLIEREDSANAVGDARRVLEVHMFSNAENVSSQLEALSDLEALGQLEALSPLEALSQLGQRCEQDPSLLIRTVLHHAEASTRALAISGRVPGFGWRIWEPHPLSSLVQSTGPYGLTNGLISVDVNTEDGTFSVNGQAGYGHIIDDVDVGDTYNWCPTEPELVVRQPQATRTQVIEQGPLRGRLRIDSEYLLPSCAPTEPAPEPESLLQVVTTVIELRADEGILRVTTSLNNQVRDHRMRVHFPLQERASNSRAECAFGLVQRPLAAEGGPNEWGVPTFPSRRFVQAGDLTVTHEGLCEYELVDLDGDPQNPLTTAGALALTLLRCTGWLSRGPMASRPLPAGPENQLLGAQMQKPLTLNYAIALNHPDPYELADRVWSPLQIGTSAGEGSLANEGSKLDISGMEVDAVLTDSTGRLVVRCHEPWGHAARMRVLGRSGQIIDLLGNTLGPFAEELEVRPHQILTLSLDPT